MTFERSTRSNFKLNWSSFPSPAESRVKPRRWTFAINDVGLEGRSNKQRCCADSNARFTLFIACQKERNGVVRDAAGFQGQDVPQMIAMAGSAKSNEAQAL